jgi:hypothetical protein
MLRPTKRLLALLTAALALSLFGGCAGPWTSDWHTSDMFDLKKPWPFKDDDKPKKGTPVRMASTWTDTILRQGGATPQRGFGGRVMFYAKEGNEPILVDGQFVVYAFDETNREPTDNKPTRRYVFPPEQVAVRESKSELGASYSFWLPWDEVGGAQTNISLICRFEPKKGSVIVGEQTQHLLPGTLRPNTMVASNTPPKLPEGTPMRPAVRQMSYTTPAPASGNPGFTPLAAGQVQAASYQSDPSAAAAAPGAEPLDMASRRMTTTSINLPESFQRRTILDTAGQSGGASISAADHLQAIAAQRPGQSHAPTQLPAAATPQPQPIAAPQPMPRQTVAAPQAAVAAPPTSRYAQAGASVPTAFQAFTPGNMSTMQPPNNNFAPAMTGPQQFASPQQAAPTSGVNPATLPQETQMPAAQTSVMPAGVGTTVSYLPVGAPSRPGMIPLPSFGSTPGTPQAPATPAFQ